MVGATGEGKGLSLRVTRRWLEMLERYDPAMVVSDFTSGEGLIQKLVELEPDDPLSHTNLSRILMQKGLIPEAEDAKARAMGLQMKQGSP